MLLESSRVMLPTVMHASSPAVPVHSPIMAFTLSATEEQVTDEGTARYLSPSNSAHSNKVSVLTLFVQPARVATKSAAKR